jgi:hypothetical protein
MQLSKLIPVQEAEVGKWYVTPSNSGGHMVLLLRDGDRKIPILVGKHYAKAAEQMGVGFVHPLGDVVIQADHEALFWSSTEGTGALAIDQNGLSIKVDFFGTFLNLELISGETKRLSRAAWVHRWSLCTARGDALERIFEFGVSEVS